MLFLLLLFYFFSNSRPLFIGHHFEHDVHALARYSRFVIFLTNRRVCTTFGTIQNYTHTHTLVRLHALKHLTFFSLLSSSWCARCSLTANTTTTTKTVITTTFSSHLISLSSQFASHSLTLSLYVYICICVSSFKFIDAFTN